MRAFVDSRPVRARSIAPAIVVGMIATIVVVGSACGASLSPDGLADTRIRAACHFAFACCSATERDLVDPSDFKDEGTCVEETEQEGNGLFVLDQAARDAIARKTATYDADAAQKCTQPVLDDVNQCKADKFFDASGQLNSLELAFLVDPTDANCVALADRDFVRGTVKDGGACETLLDCADFGNCVPDPNADPNTIALKNKCKTPGDAGADCGDDSECTPGTFCDGNGKCHAQLDDAADCGSDSACKSGTCADVVKNGKCANSQTACTLQTDCAPDDFCGGGTPASVCVSSKVDVQVCTGKPAT